MNVSRRVKAILEAVPPVLAIAAITLVSIIGHNVSVNKVDQNARAVAIACKTTHDGLTRVITAVGVAVLAPQPQETPAEVAGAKAFVKSLQDAADNEYQKCLTGVTP